MLEEQIAWTSEHFNWNVCLVYIQPFFVTNLWANSFWRIAPVILQWGGLMFECYLTSKSSLSLACGQAGSSLFSFNFLNIKQCFVFPENNCLILKSNENWKKMIFTILLSRQSVRSYFQIYEIIHAGQKGQFLVIYKSMDFMQRSLSFRWPFRKWFG